jgi:hypothetical protein
VVIALGTEPTTAATNSSTNNIDCSIIRMLIAIEAYHIATEHLRLDYVRFQRLKMLELLVRSTIVRSFDILVATTTACKRWQQAY